MESLPLDVKEAAFVALTVVALLAGAKWFVSGRRVPLQKMFRCARCSAVESHSARTIDAWRVGKTKFFCGSCHAKWLQSQPRVVSTRRESSSGCLGVLLLALAVPALVSMVFYYVHRIA
jgi:hypothetical protein